MFCLFYGTLGTTLCIRCFSGTMTRPPGDYGVPNDYLYYKGRGQRITVIDISIGLIS